MSAGQVLSVDIGSTYTKAALIDINAASPSVLKQAALPTTQGDLSIGFGELARALLGLPAGEPLTRRSLGLPVYVSSSAKGGLAIAAIGLVPDLTVHVAELAAASAGGKIAAAFPYRLADGQLRALECLHPDIVLLCGGTDGGNESYVLRNARALAVSRLDAAILYAGNAAVREEVSAILANRPFVAAENVMPEVGTLNIEPARRAIQRIFLERIVEGRGLSRVRELCAGEIMPTPLAVFELLGVLSREKPEWADSALVDMGGATTDIDTCSESFRAGESWVLKGIQEPTLKRTVEGDLGLRVSARSAAETGRQYIASRLSEEDLSKSDFASWIERISARTDLLPACDSETRFDEILAEACLYHAIVRHAGSVEETYTSSGRVYVQRGKDLRAVRRVILSGGYLSRLESPGPVRRVLARIQKDTGGLRLAPAQPEVWADQRYLLPVFASIAGDFPGQAALLAARNLKALGGASEGRTTDYAG